MKARGAARRAHLAFEDVLEGLLWWSLPALAVSGVEPLWPWLPAAAAAYGVWRGATLRVTETGDGLVVRNHVRTYRLAWTDVESVEWSDRTHSVRPVVRLRGRWLGIAVRAMAGWMGPRSREDTRAVRRWQEAVQNVTS